MASFFHSNLRFLYRKFYQKLHYDTFKILLNQGKIQAESNRNKKSIKSLDEVEFQVFSQRGEDGIIQYIISQIEIPNRIFVEFGVEDYTESNTRFLLINNHWSGLVMDASKRNIRFIKEDFIYWKYEITAYQSFITKENINELITNYTKCRDIGLLSIDIDGNDYWIWQAIEVINPRVVVCEYNSLFGDRMRVSVPYATDFDRTKVHYSNLYFGASLAAFCELAEEKGYDFIGTTGAGVNAFFVRKDLSASFRKLTAAEGFVASANRDSKDKKGRLTFLPHEKRLELIKELPVVELETGNAHLIKELYQL